MNTEQERADFEAFMRKRYPDVSLKRFATGCYLVSMARHHWEGWKNRAALQLQDWEDAQRFRKIMSMTRAEREEVLFFASNRDVLNAIDHARHTEGNHELFT